MPCFGYTNIRTLTLKLLLVITLIRCYRRYNYPKLLPTYQTPFSKTYDNPTRHSHRYNPEFRHTYNFPGHTVANPRIWTDSAGTWWEDSPVRPVCRNSHHRRRRPSFGVCSGLFEGRWIGSKHRSSQRKIRPRRSRPRSRFLSRISSCWGCNGRYRSGIALRHKLRSRSQSRRWNLHSRFRRRIWKSWGCNDPICIGIH